MEKGTVLITYRLYTFNVIFPMHKNGQISQFISQKYPFLLFFVFYGISLIVQQVPVFTRMDGVYGNPLFTNLNTYFTAEFLLSTA